MKGRGLIPASCPSVSPKTHSRCPKIQVLHLENAPVTSSALATVAFNSTLRDIRIPNSNLKDEDAATLATAIAESQSVEELDLRGNDMTDIGCVAFENALGKNSSVQSLKLDGNGRITSEHRSKIEGQLKGRVAMAA